MHPAKLLRVCSVHKYMFGFPRTHNIRLSILYKNDGVYFLGEYSDALTKTRSSRTIFQGVLSFLDCVFGTPVLGRAAGNNRRTVFWTSTRERRLYIHNLHKYRLKQDIFFATRIHIQNLFECYLETLYRKLCNYECIIALGDGTTIKKMFFKKKDPLTFVPNSWSVRQT